jgi:dipeptidyl aminopeptidase/acylaminoacyl peptidase
MRAWVKRFVLSAAGLAGLSSGLLAQTHPALKDATFPPLVPITLLADVARESRSAFLVSPDGRSLSWLQRVDGRRQIHVRPIEGGDTTVIKTPQDVGTYQWAADSRHLLAPIDPVPGAENYQVRIVDSQTPAAAARNVTPWPGTRNSVLVFRDMPDAVYLLSNRRDRRYFDLYRLALPVTGEPQLVTENPGRVSRWLFDAAGKVIARQTRPDSAGRRLFERCDAVDACTRLFDLDLEDQVTILDSAAGEPTVWALSNRGRDKTAVVRLDLKSGVETVVHADPTVDVTSLHLSVDRRQALLATSWPDRQKLHFFDPTFEVALKPLNTGPDDVVTITSTDNAQRWLILTVAGPQQPSRTVLLDRQSGQRTVLARSSWEPWRESLSPLRSATVTARDGRSIPIYITVPRGTSGRGLPTVMLIHGGPWLRDFGTSSPTVQFLANRGYAVVQVNYRGSAGYGKDHLWAGVGEFGRKMSDDIDDAAKWAIDQGIADPGRIALMGGSYGGYATKVGLTRTPRLYAAGVSFVGLSDLPAFIDLLPDYWEPHRWHRFLGKPGDLEARARMWEVSPLRLVTQVERPMLIIHGANDPRVRRDQGERFAGALKSLGKPVELQVFTDEGHGLTRPANRARYYTMVETFLARHLGGRATPPRATGGTPGTVDAPGTPSPPAEGNRPTREPPDNIRR